MTFDKKCIYQTDYIYKSCYDTCVEYKEKYILLQNKSFFKMSKC